MLKIELHGVRELQQKLSQFSDRRFQSVVATALTRTAGEIGREWTQQLTSRFDRPTRATVRAVVVKPASNTSASMFAEVKVRDQLAGGAGKPPVDWLDTHEVGGRRRTKKFEEALQAQGAMPMGWHATPGPGAKLDMYGNVSRGQIVQVLAQLGAKYSPGYARVISASAAKRAARATKLGRAYIALLPGNKSGITPGVYERRGRQLVAVFFFVRSTSYRKRLNLMDSARQDVGVIVTRNFARAIAESAARMGRR